MKAFKQGIKPVHRTFVSASWFAGALKRNKAGYMLEAATHGATISEKPKDGI